MLHLLTKFSVVFLPMAKSLNPSKLSRFAKGRGTIELIERTLLQNLKSHYGKRQPLVQLQPSAFLAWDSRGENVALKCRLTDGSCCRVMDLRKLSAESSKFLRRASCVAALRSDSDNYLCSLVGTWGSPNEGCELRVERLEQDALSSGVNRTLLFKSVSAFRFIVLPRAEHCVLVWSEIRPKETETSSVSALILPAKHSGVKLEPTLLYGSKSRRREFVDMDWSSDKSFFSISVACPASGRVDQTLWSVDSLESRLTGTRSPGQMEHPTVSTKSRKSRKLLARVFKQAFHAANLRQATFDSLAGYLWILLSGSAGVRGVRSLLLAARREAGGLSGVPLARIADQVSAVEFVGNNLVLVTNSSAKTLTVHKVEAGRSQPLSVVLSKVKGWEQEFSCLQITPSAEPNSLLQVLFSTATVPSASLSLPFLQKLDLQNVDIASGLPPSKRYSTFSDSFPRGVVVLAPHGLSLCEISQKGLRLHCIYYNSEELSAHSYRPESEYLLASGKFVLAFINVDTVDGVARAVQSLQAVLKPLHVSLTTWSSGSQAILSLTLRYPDLLHAVHYRAPEFTDQSLSLLNMYAKDRETCTMQQNASVLRVMLTVSPLDCRVSYGHSVAIANGLAALCNKTLKTFVTLRECTGSHTLLEPRSGGRGNHHYCYGTTPDGTLTEDYGTECAGTIELLAEELYWIQESYDSLRT